MARKSRTIDPNVPVIPPIVDAPGPEADADALDANYRLVQAALATHAYDDIIYVCHWCLIDAPLPYAKVSAPRGGTRMYCSKRCAEAYDAYTKSRDSRSHTVTVSGRIDPPGPNMQNIPVPSDDGDSDGVPIAQVTEIVGEEGQGQTERLARMRGKTS